MTSEGSPRGSSSVTTTMRARSPATRPISGRFCVSRSPAEPKTAMTPPPLDAASGARRSSTVWRATGLWAKSTTTPNGWPRSIRSIRPGTTARDARPSRTCAGSRPDGLAEGDDRQRVVDIEPADQLEIEGRRARRRLVGDAQAASVLLDAGRADVGRFVRAVGEDAGTGLLGHPDERPGGRIVGVDDAGGGPRERLRRDGAPGARTGAASRRGTPPTSRGARGARG